MLRESEKESIRVNFLSKRQPLLKTIELIRLLNNELEKCYEQNAEYEYDVIIFQI
jgi:hypothetical protein